MIAAIDYSYSDADMDDSRDVEPTSVLILDNSTQILTLLQRACSHFGLKSMIAENQYEALDLVLSYPTEIGVVVIDIASTDVETLDFVCELRRLQPRLKICLMGANRPRHGTVDLLIHCDDYFPKPFKFETMMASISRLMHQSTEISSRI